MTHRCAVCHTEDVPSDELERKGETDYLCDECEEALI